MTREIKFRTWYRGGGNKRIEGEMLYSDKYYAGALSNFVDDTERGGLAVDIMQFTGLYDKNNQPIYEGDILKKYNRIYQVKYHIDSYYCGFVLHYVTGKNISHGDYDNVEIIGNIYEHSHLLTNNQGN